METYQDYRHFGGFKLFPKENLAFKLKIFFSLSVGKNITVLQSEYIHDTLWKGGNPNY